MKEPARPFAERIGGASFLHEQQGYKFAEIERKRDAFVAAHPSAEIIDFGLGEPERFCPKNVIEALVDACREPVNRVYPLMGPLDFREAAARHLERSLGIKIDPRTELMMSIGAKHALSLIPFAFVNAGDFVIATTPGYPVIPTVTRWIGGNVILVPLLRKNNYLPPLEYLEELVARHRPKIVLLNYPNNPTGAVAPYEFYEKVVKMAHQHSFVLVQDAPYIDFVYEGKAASPLQVPGGKEVTLEVYSVSKTFNLQGFRIGYVAGSKDLVRAFSLIREHTDSGQYLPLQKSAIVAFDSAAPFLEESRVHYRGRQKKVAEIFARYGIEGEAPPGGVYHYCKVPARFQGLQFKSGMEFTEFLIEKHGIITVPWETDEGPHLRLSMTFESGKGSLRSDEDVYASLEQRLSGAQK